MDLVYDLFLSHNSEDKPAVREVSDKLKRRHLKPWLDVENLQPGQRWQDEAEKVIRTCRAAAVFVGQSGMGPWEEEEMRALLTQAVRRKIPVIPVLLPGAPKKPDLPLFLEERTWVDLRNGITPDGLDLIVWGITGKKPRSKKKGSQLPFLHNLPYPPLGDLLKGRDEELRKLAEGLEAAGGSIVQHLVLYGLGGIGKTRLAVEHTWASGYNAAFFIQAVTPAGLRTGLASLARADLLNLGERKAEDETVHAVLGWLKTNPGWLLILDNVDTPEAESEVLALLPGLTGGRVLITSRLQRWPLWVHTQPLGTIPLEEARDFLLKRTNGRRRKAPDDADRVWDLAQKLDGLPLALEQAGAYIARTRVSFSKYLEVWEEERQREPEWPDQAEMGYPASVATTWKASFERLKPTGATLLRLCAFLAPDPIPDEMFESEREKVEGACELLRSETGQEKSTDSTHEALAELEGYSLISRQEATFTVHRVVQEVLQSRIPAERLRDWIEAALEIVNGYSPMPPDDVRTWPVWNVLRPHAARIVLLADQMGVADPASRLMSQLGEYLYGRGLYTETEPLMRRSLDIAEATFGSKHTNVASCLNNLALLLQAMNRLSEAAPLMRRALEIDEDSFGTQHPTVAIRLNNLALLLFAKKDFSEAEPLMRRALSINTTSFGSENPDVAIGISNLAALLHAIGRYSEAEPLMRQALTIDEAAFGSEHPQTARDLNNLARLLQDTNRLLEAEPLMRRAVGIWQRSLGRDHPNTKIAEGNLARLLAEIANQSSPPPAPGGGDSV